MDDRGNANAAVQALNGRDVDGRVLQVSVLDSCTTKIFVNNAKTIDETQLYRMFSPYGNILRLDKVLNYAFVVSL